MRTRDWRLLAALTIAAAAIRFATIDVQSYWFDEALTAKLVGIPFWDMLSSLPDTELTPPLYYVVAWPWAHLIGSQEAALRSLSALFGIAAVPVAWAVTRELVEREKAALAAAALVAFNPLLIWYSQEARPYALLVLLGALSLLFFARRQILGWAIVSALALLTHYFAAFLVVPEGLWLAYSARPRTRALAAGAAVAAVGAALIPLAAHERSKIGTGYIEGLSLRRRAIGVPEDFLVGLVVKFDETWEQVLEAAALAMAAAGVVLAWMRARAQATPPAALALISAGVPLLLAIVGEDYLNTRNVIVACVPFLVALAIGLSRGPAIAGVVLLCAIGIGVTVKIAADVTYQRSDFRGAAEAAGPPGTIRALVVPGQAGETATERYLHGLKRMPPTGAAVEEVAMITPRSAKLSGAAVARPQMPPRLPPPFHLTEKRYAEGYTLVRYRAPRPTTLRPAQLTQLSTPVVNGPVVLVQRP